MALDLNRQVGPLPLWAWGAGGLVGVGGLLLVARRKNAAAADTSGSTPAGSVQQPRGGYGGGGYGGGGGGFGGGGPLLTPNPPPVAPVEPPARLVPGPAFDPHAPFIDPREAEGTLVDAAKRLYIADPTATGKPIPTIRSDPDGAWQRQQRGADLTVGHTPEEGWYGPGGTGVPAGLFGPGVAVSNPVGYTDQQVATQTYYAPSILDYATEIGNGVTQYQTQQGGGSTVYQVPTGVDISPALSGPVIQPGQFIPGERYAPSGGGYQRIT